MLVHLIDPDHGGHDATLAVRDAGTVWLAGSSSAEREAWGLGLHTTQRLSVPGGVGEIAARTIGRLWDDHVGASRERIQTLVCWSTRLLGAARIAMAARAGAGLVCVLTHAPSADAVRAVQGSDPSGEASSVVLAALGEPLAATWRRAGVHQVEALDLPSVRVDNGSWRERREAVRAELGIEPGEVVTLLLGDPPRAGDARRFAAVLGMVRIAVPSAVGLVPRGAWQVRRAASYTRKHGRIWDLMCFDGPTLAAMPAADIVFWDSDSAAGEGEMDRPIGGMLGAAVACANGVPVIAVRGDRTTDLLEAAGDDTLAATSRVPKIVQRLLPMVDSAEMRRSVGERLRAAATQRMDASRFLVQLEALAQDAVLGSPTAGMIDSSRVEVAR